MQKLHHETRLQTGERGIPEILESRCGMTHSTIYHIQKTLKIQKNIPRTKYTTTDLITYIITLLIIPW
jgi:hypothetical protein